MKKTIIILLLLNIINIYGQEAMVFNGNNPESELHAAINPEDNNNIIVATINGFSYGDSPGEISIYYTLNFGDTWQKSSFHGIAPNHVGAGDPVLRFDNNGIAYLVNLSADISNGKAIIHTIMSFSTDKGITWQSMVTNNGQTDKPWLAIDNNLTSTYVGNKYIPTTIEINNSSKVKLAVLDKNNIIKNNIDVFHSSTIDSFLPCVEINSNGNIFVSAFNNNSRSLIIAKSIDGGMSFENHSTITTIQLKRSSDQIIGINERMQCSPYMAIDKSGGNYNNRIYVTYTDYEKGNSGGVNTILDVYLTWSDDNGISWSTPKIVHSGAKSNTQQYYSNIYINNDGELLIGWYDRRNDPTHKMTNYYLGISTDGGDTITEVKASSIATDFSTIGAQNENFGIGEYCQVVATDDIAIPFWADGRSNDGDINIYFSKINIDNPVLLVHEFSSISDKININIYPNPSINNATANITLKEATRLQWKIIDINGKEVSNSILQDYSIGLTKIDVPLKALSSGSYFIQFISDNNFIKTIKIIKK